MHGPGRLTWDTFDQDLYRFSLGRSRDRPPLPNVLALIQEATMDITTLLFTFQGRINRGKY